MDRWGNIRAVPDPALIPKFCEPLDIETDHSKSEYETIIRSSVPEEQPKPQP